MPLGTLDATPPPFFRQGPSALSKLVFFSALALFLMVADVRLKVAQPLRVVVATALYPVQWLILRPVLWLRDSGQYFESVRASRSGADAAQLRLNLQSQLRRIRTRAGGPDRLKILAAVAQPQDRPQYQPLHRVQGSSHHHAQGLRDLQTHIGHHQEQCQGAEKYKF